MNKLDTSRLVQVDVRQFIFLHKKPPSLGAFLIGGIVALLYVYIRKSRKKRVG